MHYHFHRQPEQGLTLVELMVAMAISLLIALAAIAALVVSRQGLGTVDAASQLRDSSRFASDILQRLGVQTGFRDLDYSSTVRDASNEKVSANPLPSVFGLNNASRVPSNEWYGGTTRASSTALGYGSDILVLRYQTSAITPNAATSDSSMIDCLGQAVTTPPGDRDTRMISILHIGVGGDNEPALMCSRYIGPAASPYLTAPMDTLPAGAQYDSQPLVKGVEVFQVLYGVDGVPPNNTATLPAVRSVPDRYLRADELTIQAAPGNINWTQTNPNWNRVRSIRIGMVLRGPPNSAQGTQPPQQYLYPFGPGKSGSGAAAGSAFVSANDPQTQMTWPSDGRLRQVVTFTIHLRNDQTL